MYTHLSSAVSEADAIPSSEKLTIQKSYHSKNHVITPSF